MGDYRDIVNWRKDDIVFILKKKLDVIEVFVLGFIFRYIVLKSYVDLDVIVVFYYLKYIKNKLLF